MSQRIPVAVLAAAGSVGQRFVQLLDGHPWFEVVALAGSERASGKPYGEACRWLLPGEMPAWARQMPLLPCDPQSVQAHLVFSALPTDAAREIEPLFAQAGAAVCTNASAFRTDPQVPLLLPEVNPDHAHLVSDRARSGRGWIAANPNCTSTGMTVALKALQDAFGVSLVFAVSMQALSGAGYPGVASLDAQGNVVPFIEGEEPKIEKEPGKILGALVDGHVQPARFPISVSVNRVPVRDGHTESVFVRLGRRATLEEVRHALESFSGEPQRLGLFSAPAWPIHVRDEQARPQPVRDVEAGRGMVVTVGRLRHDPVFDVKFTLLVHNTVRGAAGAALLNAELLAAQGRL